MTPTKDEIDDVPTVKWAQLCVKVKHPTDGVEIRKFTPVALDARGRGCILGCLKEVIVKYKDDYIQAYVMVNDKVAGVELYGDILWLDRVPPPKYWLNYNTRPKERPSNIAPCGLPIPSRYMEAENEVASSPS